MIRRKLPAELGRLVEVHRPLHPAAGWGILAVLTLPFPILLATDGLVWGLGMLVGLGLAWTYGFAELLLLEHRLYEHGIVFRSIPGLRTYVVPHATIDPDSFHLGGRRVHDGGVAAALDRRFRQCPLIGPTIRFSGLDPSAAHRLGKGRDSWAAARGTAVTVGGSQAFVPPPVVVWMATYRDPERNLALIRDTVHRSQQATPYRGGRRAPDPLTGP